MFVALARILDVFLSPFTWAVVLLALGLPWRRPARRGARASSGRRARARRRFGLAGFGVLLFFALDPVSNAMLYHLEHATTSTFRDDVVYDVVILLGGVSDERVVAETGQPAFNDNVERLTMTHRLLAEGRARTAIVSSGVIDPSLVDSGEARVLQRQLVAWGIDPSRILLEEEARNTRENAVYSKRIVEQRGLSGRVLVVTSAFHMRRAAECFEAVGMEVDTLAVDYRAYGRYGRASLLPRAEHLRDSERTLREFFGLYIYRARGYAKPRA